LEHDDLITQLTMINSTLEHHSTLLERIDRVMYGNGRKGLLDRVSCLESELVSQRKECAKHIKAQRYMITTTIALSVALISVIGLFVL